jgi:hypothetical protein
MLLPRALFWKNTREWLRMLTDSWALQIKDAVLVTLPDSFALMPVV